MNVQFRDSAEPASSVGVKTAIADCDIHPARATKTELYPYLARRWHEHLETYDKHQYQGMMEGPPYPKAPAERVATGRLSAGRRSPGFVAVVHAAAASRSEQCRAGRSQSARQRTGHPQS